ncbi:MAG: hypothetical protein HUN04_22330 [Desulfobacter sp.]|nr:MAG: hypothetical protein HUN04_22330 [Desulfobacter sp.]|eukprot:Anaeramoba_ignava/a7079_3.p1 GENE.a7079_3~~a7079_3.p1  ORF type:complete len:115 (+),score=15.69 a7079_3:52-396(+)
MGAFQDLTGRRFGKLKVMKTVGKNGGSYKWLCKCDCGNEKVIFGKSLSSGKTRSCGCLQKEMYGLILEQRKEKAKRNNQQARLGNKFNLSWEKSAEYVAPLTLKSILEKFHNII